MNYTMLAFRKSWVHCCQISNAPLRGHNQSKRLASLVGTPAPISLSSYPRVQNENALESIERSEAVSCQSGIFKAAALGGSIFFPETS